MPLAQASRHRPHPQSPGRLKASDADRDKVIDLLKAAFVQGQLTKDELDTRAGHALTTRSHADLAALPSWGWSLACGR